MAKTRKLLEEWNSGLHSWFGKCNLLKMSILPKFLYLLQTLPIKIPPQYFKQIHSIFIKFIWAKSKPRLRRNYLTLPKHYGGLALPDLKNYYKAIHLGRIIDWNRHGRNKLWIQLEQAQSEVTLKGAVWCFDRLPATLKSHPIIGTSLRVGSSTISAHTLSSESSPLYPILGNPAFPPGMERLGFETLKSKGSSFTFLDRQ